MTVVAVRIALFLLLGPVNSKSEMWKYTTKDGKTEYSDSFARIPPEYKKEATAIKQRASGKTIIPAVAPSPSTTKKAVETGKQQEMQKKRIGIDVDVDGNGKEYWQKRLRELQIRLRDLEDKVRMWRQANDSVYKGFDRYGTYHLGGNYNGSLGQAQAALDAYKAELPKLTEEIHDEARRKRAPPGWLR